MILTLALLLLFFGSTMVQSNIPGSPDLKTLAPAGVNPALELAVKSALKKIYNPNPDRFMNSNVFPINFANF
jgi:hypothetical protein